MTNGDWIRGMTDEELYKNMVSPCDNYGCGDCPWNNQMGKCMMGAKKDVAMEWLESEHAENHG